MAIDFAHIENYFVAYIDILGFSQMVLNDFENSNDSDKNMDRLFAIHNKTAELADLQNVNIFQFSDSIVLATEFRQDKFKGFINIIAKYQYDLLCQGILCRGGVAYGKHFFNEGFMYSAGLIEAYKIEKEVSINPKIVISPDLFSLLYPYNEIEEDISLLREDDATVFVDYLQYYEESNNDIIDVLLKKYKQFKNDSRILSKYRWLDNYIGYKIPSKNSHTDKFFR